MHARILRLAATWPALVALPLALSACQREGAVGGADSATCDRQATPISTIQGDGFQSPLAGQVHTVRGVVTFTNEAGVFIQSLAPDPVRSTSEGLYIAGASLVGLLPGQRVAVTGTVRELGEGRDTLTALEAISQSAVCGDGEALPLDAQRLPMNALKFESLEGMRLSFGQPLVVTDVHRLAEGRLQVSADALLPAPTEVAFPGKDARRQYRENRQNVLSLKLREPMPRGFPVGTPVASLTGVLGHNGSALELQLENGFHAMPHSVTRVATAARGDVRVAGINLQNYFNGDGEGGGFPTPRGAETAGEFETQRNRLVAALAEIQPRLVAVMELENDGFGEDSAAADLLEDLRRATGTEWSAVRPEGDRVGSDEIRVGLFYDPQALAVVGETQLLESRPFRDKNRVPMAQVFEHLASGTRFLVAVNHLKSKGSCPEDGEDADQRDGAGCWNATRATGAQAMINWVKTLAGEAASGRALVLGDINAYRMEEPIARIIHSGFADLTAPAGLAHEYSYVWRGAAGTLDHAFASAPMRPHVWRAQILKMNAGFPPGMPLPHEWQGFSDHDPVMVDLRFSQDSTSP